MRLVRPAVRGGYDVTALRQRSDRITFIHHDELSCLRRPVVVVYTFVARELWRKRFPGDF